jgi:hypothetical protein
MFLQKVNAEKKIRKNRGKKLLSVFPRLFVLSRFRVFLSDGISKILQRKFAKNVSKSFYKRIDQKNPKPIFSRTFLSRFSVRGVQNKTDQPWYKTDQPWCFFLSAPCQFSPAERLAAAPLGASMGPSWPF